jgi:hypothetical protein
MHYKRESRLLQKIITESKAHASYSFYIQY